MRRRVHGEQCAGGVPPYSRSMLSYSCTLRRFGQARLELIGFRHQERSVDVFFFRRRNSARERVYDDDRQFGQEVARDNRQVGRELPQYRNKPPTHIKHWKNHFLILDGFVSTSAHGSSEGGTKASGLGPPARQGGAHGRAQRPPSASGAAAMVESGDGQ